MMSDQAKIIAIAKIGAPKGLKGFLALHSFSEQGQSLNSRSEFYIQLAGKKHDWQKIDSFLLQGKSSAKQQIQLNQISDRDQARQFTNALLGVVREVLPEITTDNEYYWADLEGCEVVNIQGESFGVVDHLLETGANDVLVVKNNKQEILIPFINAYVPEVDIANKVIRVDWQRDY